MNLKPAFTFLAFAACLYGTAAARIDTVFVGIPGVKVSEGGIGRVADKVSGKDAAAFRCVILRKGGKYYWASRQNRPLTRRAKGSYETFLTGDGAGYVRIVDPRHKKTAAEESETEKDYDYVEHLLLGLRSVTYYGVRQPRPTRK